MTIIARDLLSCHVPRPLRWRSHERLDPAHMLLIAACRIAIDDLARVRPIIITRLRGQEVPVRTLEVLTGQTLDQSHHLLMDEDMCVSRHGDLRIGPIIGHSVPGEEVLPGADKPR